MIKELNKIIDEIIDIEDQRMVELKAQRAEFKEEIEYIDGRFDGMETGYKASISDVLSILAKYVIKHDN